VGPVTRNGLSDRIQTIPKRLPAALALALPRGFFGGVWVESVMRGRFVLMGA